MLFTGSDALNWCVSLAKVAIAAFAVRTKVEHLHLEHLQFTPESSSIPPHSHTHTS